MIDVICSSCETQFRLGEEWGGRQARCPQCKDVVTIPPANRSATAQQPSAEIEQPVPTKSPPRRQRGKQKRSAKKAKEAVAKTDSRSAKPQTVETISRQSGDQKAPAPPPAEPRMDMPLAKSALEASSTNGSAVKRWLQQPVVIAGICGGAVCVVVIAGLLAGISGNGSDAADPPAPNGPVAMNLENAEPGDDTEPDSGAEPENNDFPGNDPDAPIDSPQGSVDGQPAARPPKKKLPRDPPAVADSPRGHNTPKAKQSSRIAVEETKRPTSPRGMTGLSSDYSDFHCRRLQYSHGVEIPTTATLLEVDGWRLPVSGVGEFAESQAPVLFLPRGKHAVRFRSGDRPIEVEIQGDFVTEYDAARKFFNIGDTIRTNEIVVRGGRALDVHGAPLLLNFHGAAYALEGNWSAAERKFRRSLRVNPAFSPAHLNLAFSLSKQGKHAEAVRELQLADVFNVGNVFGLAPAISEMRQQLQLTVADPRPVVLSAGIYVSSETLSSEDERIISIMESISKYAVKDEDRGKILNNLAVHFADSGRTELALDHFRHALAALKTAGPERFELASTVLANMSDACRRAGFEEADEYANMRQFVLP